MDFTPERIKKFLPLALEQFDPAGTVPRLLSIAGEGVLKGIEQGTSDFLDLVDIDRVDPSLLKYHAYELGTELIDFKSIPNQRQQIKRTISDYKLTGSVQGFENLFRTLGFEVSVIPLYRDDTGGLSDTAEDVSLTVIGNGGTYTASRTLSKYPLYGSSYLDEETGIFVGGSGIVLRTIDGGVNWDSPPSGVATDLNAVSYLNSLNAFIVGNNGKILHYDIASSKINQLPSPTGVHFRSIKFSNATTGFIVGDRGVVLKITLVAGVVSINLLNSGTLENLTSVDAIDVVSVGTVIYIVGENNTYLRSIDGGVIFAHKVVTIGSASNYPRDLTAVSVKATTFPPTSLTHLQGAIGSEEGWIKKILTGDPTALYTTDLQLSLKEDIRGLLATKANPTLIYSVGMAGSFYGFNLVTPGTPIQIKTSNENLYTIAQSGTTPNFGFVGGDRGVIISDGDLTLLSADNWVIETFAPIDRLNALTVASPDLLPGYVVQNNADATVNPPPWQNNVNTYIARGSTGGLDIQNNPQLT